MGEGQCSSEFLSCPALAPMESALHLPLAGPLLLTACPQCPVAGPKFRAGSTVRQCLGSLMPASLNWPGTREDGNIPPPSPSHDSLHSLPSCSPLLSPHVVQVTICHSQLLLIKARSLLIANPLLFPPVVTCHQLFPAPQPVLTDLPFDVPPSVCSYLPSTTWPLSPIAVAPMTHLLALATPPAQLHRSRSPYYVP